LKGSEGDTKRTLWSALVKDETRMVERGAWERRAASQRSAVARGTVMSVHCT
jgi:hypothetical protein